MHNRERIYETGMRALRPLVDLLAGLHPKGSAAIQGRADSARRFSEWSEQHRDPARPLFLVHAPSVGEGLMAQSIIAALRSTHPDAQFAFTFFSPSAERIADRVGADVSGYLPLDTRSSMHALVRALRPAVLAFVRTEIWPMLIIEARATGARTALVNAALGAGSSRLRTPARFLLGPAYRRLDAIGAVSADDAVRFGVLGISQDRVHVTGDARFDQVWQRLAAIDRGAMLSTLHDQRPLLVAGSTWPADEAKLCSALSSIPAGERPRVVFAPHEPSEVALSQLESQAQHALGTVRRLSTIEKSGTPADVILIDRLGVLADAYAAADMAYVGGGFGDSGLHSVVEPAALGIPVIYGPNHGNAHEAAALAGAGGGFIVRDADELNGRLRVLAADATARKVAGTAAVDFVRGRLGGARANAAILSDLIAAPARFR